MRSDVTVDADRKWLDLSLAQQAVWLDAKLSGSSAYQLGGWARAAGALDEAAVKQAISLIMARHDGLRLRIDDELPRQWLDESVEPPLTIIDLPSGATDPDAAFQALLEERFAGAMPLGDRPLFSVEVIRAGTNLNFMLWRFHHLIADAASVAVTIYHWLQAYEALTSGTPQELAAPSSYLKTISSDASYLESAAYQKDLAYWTDRFEALPPALIADLEARPNTDVKVPSADWKLQEGDFSEFEEAARAAGTTVQRALFGLFSMAIGRRYGQSDIVTGVALHRRDLANRHTIGMLAGVIPVRCQFDPFWTLAECIQAFSEQLDRDLRHQRLPVDILSRALGLAGTGRAGLFEAAMSYMPSDRGWNDSAVEGLPVVTGQVASKEASPLSLRASELSSSNGLAISIAVNTDYLDAAEAQAVLTLLQTACRQFLSDPDARFENLPTLTFNEQSLVVAEWNQTDKVFETGTLDVLFTAQARRTPEAIAVIGRNGEALTYAALDEQSTRLARTLAAHGVKPERVVGVRMERSTETIIALLGILKAGGVYLPLDPAYPKDRLEYIAYDAGAMLVLESLHDLTGDADLPTLIDANRLAYIIYTSGTTGLPKGVEVPHSAPVNLAFARRTCHDPLGVGDRVLAGISVGFDVSIGQLLLPLLSGAAVVIAGDLKSMGADEFWALLAKQGVTHINSVPSFLDSILDTAPAPGTLALKRLMLGGEALSGALVSRIHYTLPGVKVVNMYGPTEACIDATFHIATTADFKAAVLPIGKPLSNFRAYVLDSMLEPLGIGVTGELYLGGAGLARGYVNAADLTSERFVADPFSKTGDRLYKTGDRARWRADGSLEFLGRVDQQVKIRGFRVEPAEIAAVLLDHAALAQAVVVPRAPNPGAPVRLIAYIVPRDSNALPESSNLRAFLAKRLPDYMVPYAFVTIAAIPLNSNGKLDEKALPSPDIREGEFIAPRTPTEEIVAKLFAEVLGLEHCGAADHFFELGGHSLLATSFISKMRNAGIQLPLRAVFEAPTVELLARRIDTSLPAGDAGDVIVAQARPVEIPLSFPQERIWFVDRLQQDSSYNIPVALELRGPLDTVALERALERIIARHESLRTRLVLHGTLPTQEILAPPALNLPRIELTESALPGFLAQFAAHRFNLSASLPFEMRLLALEPERHVLAMLIHHVAFDGWSAAIFLHEFSALYNAFAQHQPDPLPTPTLQYADYAIWQRAQKRQVDLAFWLEELKGAPPQSELPTDAPPAAERPVQSLPLHLTPELHAALLRLARDSGASLFMVLHAAFALLLSRWTGQDDVVVGTVVANRSRTELESVIGCFINTLALRTTFEPGESFAALLRRVKDSDLSAFAHQDLPFEQLVEAFQPERSLQHTPIFQVMLILQNAPAPVGEFVGLTVQPIPTEVQAPQFDLTLTLTEQAGGLSGSLEFSTSRFSPATIERFGTHFRRTLEAVAQNATQDVSDVLDPAERALLLDTWSGEDRPFPKTTLETLFAEQVAAHPSALAVVAPDGRRYTYAQLDAESTRLARYLVAKGVNPERVVGVRMERSAETIIAFLAILKAGGVYLPLDPAYPSDRLEYMIANAGAMLVLDSIPTDDIPQGLPRQPDANRLAYIIYTSGTTGRPKGVAVPHSAAVNLLFARHACHDPIGPGDRILAATSVGFDVSVGQLLLPLLKGATVVIAADLKTVAAAKFWAFLAAHGVTHINSVPSFLDSILDSAPAAGALSLRRLMLGGETLSGALVSRIRRALPGVEVVNMYGPTEACVDATYHVAALEDCTAAILPIGRPLPNYRAYILDSRLKPVGVGIAGELFIGGAGLARGYVDAPALTSQSFIENPFSSVSGARLYRTGDRARWRDGGVIEFLGRADEQVKIRGFRVEPGEVEAQLRRQPGIREAAVISQSSSAGNRLIAYYCGDPAVEIEAVRKAMAAVLPDYMVPAAFVKLDKLPLSSNGKLDRRALPHPGQSAFVTRAFEPPIGDTEQKMAALWAELLKLDQVGRHDNFFELGGHSLLAVTLMQRMQQQSLPGDVRALFATPTIAGLSASVTAHHATGFVPANGILPGSIAITPEMLPLVKLTQAQLDRLLIAIPGGASNLQDVYPLAPLQEGIFFQHLMTAQGDPYLTPVLLSIDSRSRLNTFLQALNTVVQRHDVLRTGVVSKGLDEPLQFVLRNVSVPTEELSFSSSQDISAALLHHFDPRLYRMDLTQAPLLRVAFAQDPTHNRWLLLLLTHHLILDHTSQEILVFELRALMADSQAILPAPLPYRNFIAQTRSGGDTRDAQEAFFTRLLSTVEEPTAPFGLLDVQSGGVHIEEGILALDATLARQIREQARALGVTPASIFHLAWAAVLAHVSSKPDVVFGTILFGRMRSGAGADRVVGMFINTLPVRIDIDNTGVAASVVQTHQLLAELLLHEHAPLVLAQRCSNVPAPAPLFSALFNYRYSPEEGNKVEWPGVEMVNASERTNYPLSMAIDDSGSGFVLRSLAHPFAGADRVCLYLQQALKAAVDLLEHEPTTPVKNIQVLPRRERHLVLEDWNHTDAKFEQGTLDGLFTAQARRTPSALAVIGIDGAELTYGQLDSQSTQLARQLVAQNTGPRLIVGVRMQRSAETIIAMLAILKAGGVYLPLDPAYPRERLEYIAKDAEATLILDSIRDLTGEADLPNLTSPSRLAYIIYTSGTTGRPKGVAVPHSAPVNLAFARRLSHDPIGPGDRILAAISVGFDVSIGQLLLPLLSGAAVVVAPDLKTMSPAQFWAFLVNRHITHINSVPSFLDSILDSAPADGTLSLKRLMLGGEALSGALVSRIQQVLPAVEVVNLYGPTEACIDATYHVATDADLSAAILPIGRPLSNYRAYVLDTRLEPAGVGVTGELYLGGVGLARGYVNSPELTAERFINDPFAATSGAKLYRTGDLARWRADGAIEFLGRVDQQVKIRGFRVEPGEIEAQLRKQPGIREAAVVSQAGRLIAYYCGDDDIKIDTLRDAMSAALPDYMVPSAFIKLDQLPLSANGKLDRKALPHPDKASFASRTFEPPMGELEEKMATLWAELLKVEQVGRHDNFFELGGHSLLAMTLVERMQQQGLAIDVRALFSTPTIAGLAAASASAPIQIAAPENRILPGAQHITPEMLPLVTLSQSQIDKLVATVPGGAANVQDIYPLAPLQEGLLFQHLMAIEGDPYLLPLLMAFDTRNRLDDFAAALSKMAERHDVLRSAMVWKDVDNPLQVVLRQVDVPLEQVSLDSTLSAPDAASQLLQRFDPSKFRLDLSKAPLLRAIVAQDIANNRWLLLMLTHHLVLDHTSMAVMVAELRALMASPLATLPPSVPYRNFVAQAIQGVSAEQHEAFFSRMLADVDEPTAPFGLVDTQVNASQITESDLPLSPFLSRRIRERSRALGVTPASLFHTAWAAVLGVVTGKSDVLFGTILLGRMRSGEGAGRSLGMFINTLPVRFALDETPVRQAVVSAQTMLAELIAHEHAPLSLAQRASAVPPPTPLFSSLLNYRYTPDEDQTPWPGAAVIHASGRTNYPVSMAIDDSGSGFTLRALAHRSAGAERVNSYFELALNRLVDLLENAPQTPIRAVSVIPAAERRLVLEEWNQTAADFEQATLDGLFSAQTSRTPDAVAIIAEDGTPITYAELDSQSTRLARQLAANGLKPEKVVGVRMSRSAEAVVALLAILKAGGVYLPLDPAYPSARLKYMIDDADAILVLDSIHGLNGDADLPSLMDPNRLAYIIYTSGTTGQPKGVAVPHSAAVNLMFARNACHDPLEPGDRVLAVTSVSFDVSVGQLLFPLLKGATVVIAGDLKTMGGAGFWSIVTSQRITHVNFVPSFVELLLDGAPQPVPDHLKMLMLGGEALSGSLLGRVNRALPGLKVVNIYGPTETCIDATYYVATPEDIHAAVLPIGRPLSNYRTYILDSNLDPAGVGVDGELFIAGAGLARGYVKAPQLTAERFIPDPFSSSPSARMYRTGDRARWRQDGVIEFLGRIDKQIKIRGHRIELGEIEAALLQHPAVARAAVIAEKQQSGNTRLIAYVVPPAGVESPQSQQLRDYLAAHLPDYMTPSVFCALSELPLTPNGKLDFKTLPKISTERSESVQFVAPRSATEIALQHIWQQLLDVRPIGIHDNFFVLGGHSLAAMRLINACNSHFRLDLQLRALLDSPTIAQLATAIENNGSAPEMHPCLVPLNPGGTKTPLFCVHPAGGHVLGYMPLANAIDPDQPVWGLQVRALSPGQPLATCAEEMAADYILAMRIVQPVGPYQVLGRSMGGILAYEIAQQLHQAGDTVSFLCLLDTALPEIVKKISDEEFIPFLASNIGIDDLIAENNVPATPAELLDRAHAAGRLKDIQPDQFDRFQKAYKNNVLLYPAYTPKPWSGPFVLFRALKRTDAIPDWSHLVSADSITIDMDCMHDDYAEEKMAAPLARELERLLVDAALQNTPVRQGHLIPLQTNGTKRKLFCIHPAGGNSLCYLPLTRELGLDQPVYGLQANGLDAGEPLPDSMEQMAAGYLAIIRANQPTGPYQLLGMSSGGLIAFEMARQLKAAGQEVSFLGMLDTAVPRPGAQETKLSPQSLLESVALELGCADLVKSSTTLSQLVQMAIEADRLPATYPVAQAERIAAVFENTVRLHFSYQPQPWQDSLVVFARALQGMEDPPPDWSPYIKNLLLTDIDGSHYDLVTPEFASQISALLAPHLQ